MAGNSNFERDACSDATCKSNFYWAGREIYVTDLCPKLICIITVKSGLKARVPLFILLRYSVYVLAVISEKYE